MAVAQRKGGLQRVTVFPLTSGDNDLLDKALPVS